MLKFFFIFFTLILPAYYAIFTPEPKAPIYAKYVVSIADLDKFDVNNARQFGRGHFCSGAIIGPKTILTAAHCLYRRKPEKLVVIAGTPVRTKKNGNTQIMHVKKISLHPRFIDKYSPHDIGLLHLDKEIRQDDITAQVVVLPSKQYAHVGDTCILMGWGTIGNHGQLAQTIRYADLSIYATNICNGKLFPIFKTFCARYVVERAGGGCVGDAGGPIFCRDKLSGIDVVSFKCSPSEPTYFTDVFRHLSWIRQTSSEKSVYRSSARNKVDDNVYLKILGLLVCFINLTRK